MTPTIQQAIRIPTDLHEQITAEAQRLGHPHTFSSVAVNAMRAGLTAQRDEAGFGRVARAYEHLGKGPTPPRPKGGKKKAMSDLIERLRGIAVDMERAADLAERDPTRPVTRFDARRWAEEIDVLISPDEERAAWRRQWPNFPYDEPAPEPRPKTDTPKGRNDEVA